MIASPCGNTSLSIGFTAPSLAPTGGLDIPKWLKDMVPFVNQGPSFTLFSGGNWNRVIKENEKNHTDGNTESYIVGYTRTHNHGYVYTECDSNNDTIVHGNYTCRVDGYQEYSTKGDYTTNVLGKNFVTIIGMDMNKYYHHRSANRQLQAQLDLAVQTNYWRRSLRFRQVKQDLR